MGGNDIHIVGAGGLCTDLIACFSGVVSFGGLWDDQTSHGTSVEGVEVLGTVDDLLAQSKSTQVLIAVGNPIIRKVLFDRLRASGFRFPVMVHPESRAYRSGQISVGEGAVIFPHTILTSRISIGSNSIVHLGCSLHHDVRIGSHSVLMPGARVTGNAEIGDEVFIGGNVAVGNGMNVKSGSRITQQF